LSMEESATERCAMRIQSEIWYPHLTSRFDPKIGPTSPELKRRPEKADCLRPQTPVILEVNLVNAMVAPNVQASYIIRQFEIVLD